MNKSITLMLLALTLLSGREPARADITNNLVAWYNFEGLAGTVGETIVDQSGHGHDGVCRADQSTLRVPAIVAGPAGLGEALNFDGAFYVEIPNHADFYLTSNITVAAWVSVDAFDQDWQTMFCHGDWSWRLHRSDLTDYAAFHMSGLVNGYTLNGQTTNLRTPKRWLHLVGTYQNGVGASLYVNGALEVANVWVSGLIGTNGSDPVTIGAQIDNGILRRQWRGQMDEVRLYNRALSAADVAELYGYVQTNYNQRPVVTTPPDQVLATATNLLLAATVSDDGLPLPANPASPDPDDAHKLRWQWSVVSTPAGSAGVVWSGKPTNGEAFTYPGSANAPGTAFDCNPTANFDVPGIYALNFTAQDGALAASKNVTVWVRAGDDYHALGYQYLSPLPGAEYASPQTRFVLVRFKNISPSTLTNLATCIQVTGARSGSHSGQTRIAGDGRTVIFQMASDFYAGELVTVSLAPGVPAGTGQPISPYQYLFVVSGHFSGPASLSATSSLTTTVTPALKAAVAQSLTSQQSVPTTALAGKAVILPNAVSVPSDFPQINITVNNHPDPDPIFIDNRAGGGKPYNVIFDNQGQPIWYMRTPDERRDMQVQRNGVLTMLDHTGGVHFDGLDQHYRQFTNYVATNGYSVDEHELQVLPEGTYFLIALRNETVDMTRFVTNGNPAATVTEDCVQEFTAAGDLIFQWRAWDYFDIHDQQNFIDLTSASFDFPHMNAIDLDTDGNLLLSSRSTSEITKINRDTGEIIWRLGGGHNQFTYVNDPLNGTRNQHAVRMVATNHYTMFDNGNLHDPPVSRAVEYVVDTNLMTATLAWQYPATPNTTFYSYYMGDVQRLTNGNTLINWAIGWLPKLTEVRPDGTTAFEMNWVDHWESYRVWRCPWQGVALQPYLILEAYPDNLTLIFNQFGDTNVAFYRIYGGTSPQPTNLLATSGATLKKLTNLQNGSTYYFRVTAVNKQGIEGPYSNEETTSVNIIKPGQNLLQNGDFAQGTNAWIWTLGGVATAAWTIDSGVSHVTLTNGTATLANVQLKQAGIPLVQSNQYVFEFDAWSAAPRYIEAKVAQDAAPNLNYSGTTSTYLTPAHNHFRYVFTMSAATDLAASVFFNVGGSSYGVYVDNVSLFNPPPGDLNLDGRVDLLDLKLITADWLKLAGGLSPDLDGSGRVDLNDFSIFGDNWTPGQ
ncbi:MAG: aryl-sulfate sulfotransferase [Verrucomicrobiae bacterium]|nr:aryl-sulfate sulfotransferase [Verrucomicrobiae bacterium]